MECHVLSCCFRSNVFAALDPGSSLRSVRGDTERVSTRGRTCWEMSCSVMECHDSSFRLLSASPVIPTGVGRKPVEWRNPVAVLRACSIDRTEIPCISSNSPRCYGSGGGSGRETVNPLVLKTAVELGSPPAVPANPHSRLVRHARPHLQGRVMERISVGIDVAKDRLDVHVRPSGEAFAVARDGKGLEDLADRLGGLDASLVVLEATGGYEVTVAAALCAAGLPLAVVNPRQIRDFARSTGQLAKTDALDAAAIAHFAEAGRSGAPAGARRTGPRARRTGRPPAPDRRHDDRRAQPPEPPGQPPCAQERRPAAQGAPARTVRSRGRDRRHRPAQPGLAPPTDSGPRTCSRACPASARPPPAP